MVFATKAMNHVEGGWPKEVDYTEAEHVIRYRKKVLMQRDSNKASTRFAADRSTVLPVSCLKSCCHGSIHVACTCRQVYHVLCNISHAHVTSHGSSKVACTCGHAYMCETYTCFACVCETPVYLIMHHTCKQAQAAPNAPDLTNPPSLQHV